MNAERIEQSAKSMELGRKARQKIIDIREIFNMTQQELADILSVNQGHISKIETGQVVPSKQLIKHIGLVLFMCENGLKSFQPN